MDATNPASSRGISDGVLQLNNQLSRTKDLQIQRRSQLNKTNYTTIVQQNFRNVPTNSNYVDLGGISYDNYGGQKPVKSTAISNRNRRLVNLNQSG